MTRLVALGRGVGIALRLLRRALAVFFIRVFLIVVIGWSLTGPSKADELAAVAVVSAVSVLVAALEGTLFYPSLAYWRERKSGRRTSPVEIASSYLVAGSFYLWLASIEVSQEPTGWLGVGAVFGGCFVLPGVVAAWPYARRISRGIR